MTTSYLMFIGSMLIFGTIGVFRRYIPLSSGLLACIRGLLGGLSLLIFMKMRRRPIKSSLINLGRRRFLLLVLIGAIIGFNWICLFESYNYTSVANATLCYYMQPTILILLSYVFFREKLTVRKLICAGLSVLGMLMVSGVFEGTGEKAAGTSDIKGIIFGLAAAAMYATVVILNKKVQTDDPIEKTMIQLLAAAFVLIPYLLASDDFNVAEVDATAVIMILILGIFHTGVTYAMYFHSMDALPAQSIALLSYIDPVFALILSAVILHESMTTAGIIGAVLIIGAAAAGELKLKNITKKNRR